VQTNDNAVAVADYLNLAGLVSCVANTMGGSDDSLTVSHNILQY